MKSLLKVMRTSFVALIASALVFAQPALAVSSQRKGIERYPFYDKTAEIICGAGVGVGNSAPTPANTSTGGPLYLLGDSIGDGIKGAGFESQMTAAGYTPKTNTDQGRTITKAGQNLKTSGLQAVDADAEFIKTAKVIIIELGTNPENNFANNLNGLVGKIRGLNGSARIYLVDVAASPQDAQRIGAADTNKAIYAKSAELGTTVISRFKIYYPNGDPQTYAGATTPAHGFDPQQGVHSDPATDYQLLNDVIKLSLAATPPIQTPTASTSCCPANIGAPGANADTGGSITLIGNSNEEMIFNYLLRKGFSVNQAAGILGNMRAEDSTFDPRLVEGGFGFPKFMDTVPPSVNRLGQPGYGIVQWSGGRKDGLSNFASSRKIGPNDLGLQLEYVWQELNTNYKEKVLDPILASVSVEDASNIWLTKYEIPGDIGGQRPIRIGFAYAVLRQPWAIAAGANPAGAPATIPTGTTSPDCATGQTPTIGGDVQSKIVAIALQELAGGASEKNGGYLKYTDGNNEAWCADFVSWVLNQSGAPFTGGSSGGWRIAGVNDVQAWFQSKNQYKPARQGYVPKPGDILIMNTGSGPWRQHVAIVTAVNGRSIDEVGGNQATYYITKNTIDDYDASYISGYGVVGP